MNYIYGNKENYEDYASGRVIYSGNGVTNFPVRLCIEMFGRALHYRNNKENLCIYDPCCGGGYLLTIVGIFFSEYIGRIYGSDIDEDSIALARKNTSLLTEEGLEYREKQLKEMYETYGKESHREAIDSISTFRSKLEKNIISEIYYADCTQKLSKPKADIIITDVPYGNLVQWNGDREGMLNEMLTQLAAISDSETILVLCRNKEQKVSNEMWKRIEKNKIGKRQFDIYRKTV